MALLTLRLSTPNSYPRPTLSVLAPHTPWFSVSQSDLTFTRRVASRDNVRVQSGIGERGRGGGGSQRGLLGTQITILWALPIRFRRRRCGSDWQCCSFKPYRQYHPCLFCPDFTELEFTKGSITHTSRRRFRTVQ